MPDLEHAHCWHAETRFPLAGWKEVRETCCHCGAQRTFRWQAQAKAGHGSYVRVTEWVKVDAPPPAWWPEWGTVLL